MRLAALEMAEKVDKKVEHNAKEEAVMMENQVEGET